MIDCISFKEYFAEYDRRFKEARNKSDALPDGFQVGKIIETPVADNYAYYEITKVNKNTVRLKWREDLSLDGYMDGILFTGGKIDKNRIEHLVKSADITKNRG